MRIVAGILIVLALVAGAWAISNQAYEAGLERGLTQSGNQPAPGQGAPPYPGYGYRYYGHGPFGFFGFLWALLFIFLLIGLFKGLFWRHRWAAYGPGGKGVPSMFEEWHRREHEKGSTGSV